MHKTTRFIPLFLAAVIPASAVQMTIGCRAVSPLDRTQQVSQSVTVDTLGTLDMCFNNFTGVPANIRITGPGPTVLQPRAPTGSFMGGNPRLTYTEFFLRANFWGGSQSTLPPEYTVSFQAAESRSGTFMLVGGEGPVDLVIYSMRFDEPLVILPEAIDSPPAATYTYSMWHRIAGNTITMPGSVRVNFNEPFVIEAGYNFDFVEPLHPLFNGTRFRSTAFTSFQEARDVNGNILANARLIELPEPGTAPLAALALCTLLAAARLRRTSPRTPLH